jgi:Bacterial extracellular solute-binding proteins, family 5 Middle
MASSASVAIPTAVGPTNAPTPRTESERVVFRQLYETLIEVDCRGEAVQGLARSWEPAQDSATWLVRLRSEATFSDGTRVQAPDVISDWTDRGVAGGGESDLHQAIAVDDYTIRVHFYARPYDIVRFLADRKRSVSRHSPGMAWPAGTTRFRYRNGGRGFLILESIGPNRLNLIRYTVVSGSDQRDVLDDGIDVITTDRPEVVAYGQELGNYDTRVLAWSSTYFLLLEGRRPTFLAPLGASQLPFQQGIATDAITANARSYRPPSGWAEDVCGSAITPLATPLTLSRISYQAGDRTAREIAERVLFLASSGNALPRELTRLRENAIAIQHVISLSPDNSLDARETVEIVRINRALGDPCAALREAGNPNWNNAIPLVDTRAHAIVRFGSPGVLISGDGTMFFGRLR